MLNKGISRKTSFIQQLLGLVSEPAFIKFINIQTEPNIFRIVGRAHYERWHSAFIAWLLDANGSHLLGDYILTRFLSLVFDERALRANHASANKLLTVLPTVDFTDVEVNPNENSPTETSVIGVGKLDVFLTGRFVDRGNKQTRLNLLVELKIDSPTRALQSRKYADWLLKNHPNDINILVYIVPQLLSDSQATVGDDRWYCLDYQLLNDKLLLPVLDHPNLNDNVKPFLIQYIKNLKFRYRGIKMAITAEEKQLAIELYERYSDIFDSIYDALQAEGMIDYSTSDIPKGRAKGNLAVRIDGQIFQNNTLRELFKSILIYIVDKHYILRIPLPWGHTSKRFVITNVKPPVHPNGRPFFYPENYNGYAIETHYDRERGLRILDSLCQKLELDFESIEV
jgi:hypothetical protein